MKTVRMPQAHRHSHATRHHAQASTKGPATKPCGDGRVATGTGLWDLDVLSPGSTRRRRECDGRLALWEGQKCYSAATPATERSSSRSPLLSSSAEGPRKGGPNSGLSTLHV